MSKRSSSSSSSGPEEKKQRILEEEGEPHEEEEDESFVPYVPLRERRKKEAGIYYNVIINFCFFYFS